MKDLYENRVQRAWILTLTLTTRCGGPMISDGRNTTPVHPCVGPRPSLIKAVILNTTRTPMRVSPVPGWVPGLKGYGGGTWHPSGVP